MSLWSKVYPAGRIKGQPAQVRVVRNNGDAWGRIVLKDGTEHDVSTAADWYDASDCEAAAAFVRKARSRPRELNGVYGWQGMEWVPGVNEDGKESICG